MNANLKILCFLVVSVPFCLNVNGRAEMSGHIGLRLDPAEFGFHLYVSGRQATNFVLKSSMDLDEWEVLYQAFGRPENDPVMWMEPNQPHGFWQAAPGESLEQIEQRWLAQEPAEYTFRLRHMLGFLEGEVRGTVRVRNGTIIEVIDRVDALTEVATADPDELFLTITQVFEKIRQEFEAGSQHIQVRYDSTGLIPEWVLIDRLLRAVDDESLIEAADFIIVDP
jgi:hypothetical protein